MVPMSSTEDEDLVKEGEDEEDQLIEEKEEDVVRYICLAEMNLAADKSTEAYLAQKAFLHGSIHLNDSANAMDFMTAEI